MLTVVSSFSRRFRFGFFGLALVCTACSPENATDVAASPSPATITAVESGGMNSGFEWPAYNGGYDATRFSSLTRINTGNVASLAEVARFRFPRRQHSNQARC